MSLQSLHAVDVLTYVQFLPTLLNQLFSLLVKTVSDDVALNVVKWALPWTCNQFFNIKIKEINVDADYDIFFVHWKFFCRVLIHIVSEVSLVDKQDALKSYVKVGIFKSTVSRYIYVKGIRLIHMN